MSNVRVALSSLKSSGSISLILSFLGKRERAYLIVMLAAQVSLGFLDLIGVLAMGLVGAISVYAVQSRPLPDNTAIWLDRFGLDGVDIQSQVAFLASVSGIVLVSRTILSAMIAKRVVMFLSNRAASISSTLVAKFFTQDIRFINELGTQVRIHSLTTGVNNITVGVIGSTINTISDLLILGILSGGLFLVDPSMTTITVLYFTLISFLMYKLISMKSRVLAKVETENALKINNLLMQTIFAFRELYVRNQISNATQEFTTLRFKNAKVASNSAYLAQASKYALEIGLVIGAVLFSAFQFLSKDAVSAISTLSIFLIASTRIAPATLRIQTAILGVKNSLSSSYTTLDIMRELRHRPLKGDELAISIKKKAEFEPVVRAQGVYFRFDGTKNDVVQDVTFCVDVGEFVGIVGETGSGKSTLLDLILGLYPPSQGEIKISNLNPKRAIFSFPSAIAYLPQEVSIFPGTLRENLALGAKAEEIDDLKLWSSIEKAKLSDFVRNLPDGLEHRLSERGVNLSGGQRQRIGIARALYNEPKLLLLDESTSALDANTESEIIDLLLKFKGKMTVIFVTHRNTSLKHFDRVFSISKGKLTLVSHNLE